MASTLARITTRALAGERADAADLAAVLAASDVDTLDVVAAAGRVRRRHFGNRVKLNYLVNVKSGLCPEDCSYCSQAKGSQADILTYRMVEPEAVVEAASRAASVGAARVCLVASGRGPTDREVDSVAAATEAVHAAHPDVEICACLGLLAAGQADRLAAAGVHAYNHNLNTSGEHYAEICSTHTFDDRVATVNAAAEAGLSACSGALFGMGETDDDILAVIEGLAAVDPDSIPVNFLIPIDGTPLAGRWELTPWRCLRILSALRFAFPDKEVRIAGGREQHLRSLQGLGLMVANSIFVGDYLTTEGQEAHADLEMLADHGLVPLGAEDDWVPPRPSTPEVTIRRRGVGAAP